MRLSGRLSAAIEVLDDMEKRHRPVSDALKDWGLTHRFAGSGDRAAIGTLVYDALRRRASLSWRLDSDAPAALAYGALFAMMEKECDITAILTELSADSFAPPPLDVACLQAWQNRDLNKAPDEVQADIPLWCLDFFKNSYGEAWLAQATPLSERPPLDLRLNSLKTAPEKLAKALNEDRAEPISWFPSALRIASTIRFSRHPNIQATAAFQKGWFEIQDLGSQIVAHIANAQQKRQILDYCAGGGGKTLALAAACQNRGQIYAYDADKARIAPIFTRLKRAGVRNVQVIDKLQALDNLMAKMDLVVVDAPCSGSGTWRRHPDAKWRLRESQLQRRVEEQRDILEKASHFVRPGGRLVYITCSLLTVENNLQIRNFLGQNKNFQAIDIRAHWHDVMSTQAPLPHFSDIGLTLSPASTHSDGFYIAIIERRTS